MTFIVRFLKKLSSGPEISDNDKSVFDTFSVENKVGGKFKDNELMFEDDMPTPLSPIPTKYKKSLFEEIRGSCLKKKIAFYLPTKDKKGHDIPNTQGFLELIVKYFSETFGGCTVSECTGYYLLGSNDDDKKKEVEEIQKKVIDDSKEVMGEKVHYIYSYTNDMNFVELDKIIMSFKDIKEKMQQECVSFEWNNEMFFI